MANDQQQAQPAQDTQPKPAKTRLQSDIDRAVNAVRAAVMSGNSADVTQACNDLCNLHGRRLWEEANAPGS